MPKRTVPVLNPEYLDKLRVDTSDIAISLAHFLFRNAGPVEQMHCAGKLSDDDMKALNKKMVDRLAYVLNLLVDNDAAKFYALVIHEAVFGTEWDKATPESGHFDEVYEHNRDTFKNGFRGIIKYGAEFPQFKGIKSPAFAMGAFMHAYDRMITAQENGDAACSSDNEA